MSDDQVITELPVQDPKWLQPGYLEGQVELFLSGYRQAAADLRANADSVIWLTAAPTLADVAADFLESRLPRRKSGEVPHAD